MSMRKLAGGPAAPTLCLAGWGDEDTLSDECAPAAYFGAVAVAEQRVDEDLVYSMGIGK